MKLLQKAVFDLFYKVADIPFLSEYKLKILVSHKTGVIFAHYAIYGCFAPLQLSEKQLFFFYLTGSHRESRETTEHHYRGSCLRCSCYFHLVVEGHIWWKEASKFDPQFLA